MNNKILWAALPLLIVGLAVAVLRRDDDAPPVATATLACADLATGCATRLRDKEVRVGLGGEVKPLKPFQVWVNAAGAGKVRARFTMVGMDMGFNLYTLLADRDGVFRARVTLPVCVSGKRDWIMTVEIDGAAVNVPFSTEP